MDLRPVLVVDIDDVLHNYGHPHFTRHVERELSISYPYEGRVLPYLNLQHPEVSKETELTIVRMVYADVEFWEDSPIEDSVDVLTYLNRFFRIIAVTARPAYIREQTEAWLSLHFPGVFDELIFIGLKGSVENITTKLSHALTRQAVAMIDDTRHHLDGCAENDILGLLYDHPWNRPEPDHPDFVRVHNWLDIREALLELIGISQ